MVSSKVAIAACVVRNVDFAYTACGFELTVDGADVLSVIASASGAPCDSEGPGNRIAISCQ